jgi:hypothetical protein
MRRVIPFRNLRLKVPARFHHARTLSSARTLTLRDGAFILPRVEEYEVVVLEP